MYVDVKWLQDVAVTNIDVTTCSLRAEVKYTTILTKAVCVERVNLTVQLLYDINNVKHIITKPYLVNKTDSFIILSLLQSNSTISYTIQVINTAGNIVGSTTTGSFIVPPIIPSTTGIPKINVYMKFNIILITGGMPAIASTPCVYDYEHTGICVLTHILLL